LSKICPFQPNFGKKKSLQPNPDIFNRLFLEHKERIMRKREEERRNKREEEDKRREVGERDSNEVSFLERQRVKEENRKIMLEM
jgi:hypothetical protein